jgi:glycosyltransferase involved in cell wall biosynthesis
LLTHKGPNWLIFSYFFNIDGKASSQHIDDRIPHLIALGIKPALISSICSERCSDVAHHRVPSIAPSGIRFELRYLKRRSRIFRFAAFPLLLVVLPLYCIEKALINLESEWSWFAPALLRGLMLCRKRRPDLIYSTGGPPCAHLAAGLLARWTKIAWIAELQDPIVFKGWRRSKAALKLNSQLERFILGEASAVVFLTEGAREKSLQRTNPGKASKTHVIYPGAGPRAQQQGVYRTEGFCRFAHFGSLAGTRSPEKFLEAFEILLDRKPELIEKVRLHFYGPTDSLCGKIIDRFKHTEIISNFGKIPRLEALEEMQRCDALVLIQNLDDLSYETIPSKVYEYLQAKRPILALVYRNPHLRAMLLEQGHFVATGDSPTEIREQIERILEKWRKADRNLEDLPDSPYTVGNAVEKLMAIPLELAVSSRDVVKPGSTGKYMSPAAETAARRGPLCPKNRSGAPGAV